ncbi:MAG: ferrous iron transport protein B [Thermoanaerobaculia bacterium]
MTAEPILETPAPSRRRLVLVGNPNVGKSVIFGALTGKYVTVSNYPGTTVEITRGTATFGSEQREVIDTPGTNSLIPQSEDERVTRDVLLDAADADVIHVGDMKNLRRTLLLTIQIAEWGVPFTLCLNMVDEARERGISTKIELLSEILGVSVIETSAIRRWGVERLRREALSPRQSSYRIDYDDDLEEGIARIVDRLPETMGREKRAVAVAILAGDDTLTDFLSERVTPDTLSYFDLVREETQKGLAEPLAYRISRNRLAVVDRILQEVFTAAAEENSGVRAWLGGITMHRIWGLPFLGLVLFFAWFFVGKIGAGTLVDFLENTVFNGFLNPWLIHGLDAIFRFPHHHLIVDGVITAQYTLTGSVSGWHTVARFLHDLIVGPYGVVTMALTYAIAIVLPVVGTFFIFFGILEDSGYLPRLAVMINRIFRAMGLNGKAVLPMVLGLGCDTMATLTTRILETRKERVIVTLLLALGVPCSAQLGVIMAMLGALNFTATLVWLSVVGGTIFLVGFLSSKIIKGDRSDFLLELPPIRRPKLGNILIKVVARMEWYLKEAVPLFVIGTLILYVADLTGTLVIFQKAISPLIVGVLHLPIEASNAFLVGFLRRDYGAAGLFMLQRQGQLDPIQTVVSLSVITLFIPCIANFFVMIKERGVRSALYMTAFIIPYAFGIGWILYEVLTRLHVNLA